MTIRNLDRMLAPRSVALLAGSGDAESAVVRVVAANLGRGSFAGPRWQVGGAALADPNLIAVDSLDDLTESPDLAVVIGRRDSLPDIVRDLGNRGTRAVAILSEGQRANGHDRMLQDTWSKDLQAAARPKLVRLLGPDSTGLALPSLGLNASLLSADPRPGSVALISQSNTVLATVADWATHRGIGFSHLISLGMMADVDIGDLLDYLAGDSRTRSILIHAETLTRARKFMSAGRAAARVKPVIVLKAGRTPDGSTAATTHVGAMVGSDAVVDAALRRAGMVRVTTLGDLFDAAETVSVGARLKGDRLAILTNGGGMGVLAADALNDLGGRLAMIDDATRVALEKILPSSATIGNPVDTTAMADGTTFSNALITLAADKSVDAVLVLRCPTALADDEETAKALAAAASKTRVPVLVGWIGEGSHAAALRSLFADRKIRVYGGAHDAVRGFMHLCVYHTNQSQLMETPPRLAADLTPDRDFAQRRIDEAASIDATVLTDRQAIDVLGAYGIPIVNGMHAGTVEESVRAATCLHAPYAVKIASPDIAHKSDVSGVILNIPTATAVGQEAAAIRDRVEQSRPDARIDGFTVQEMAGLMRPHELIVGVTEDPVFGPVLMFGAGGTAAELIDDSAVALLPLNLHLARDLVRRTRVYRLLQGYRDRPPAALDAIARVLVCASQLVIDHERIVRLEINPLLADDTGVMVVDMRIEIDPTGRTGDDRLSIRPYPDELVRPLPLRSGPPLLLRPIRPEDEPLLQEMVAKTTAEDLRLRFFSAVRRLAHQQAAPMVQIDYDRQMALVAIENDGTPDEAMLGVVRISADPDNISAEYGVMVRSDMKGRGLGRALMTAILDYARDRGLTQVYGEVLVDNINMLRLCDELGFTRRIHPDDPGIAHVTIDFPVVHPDL